MARKGYGRRGQEWHPNFIEYIEAIAHHPVYADMPDAFTGDGLVQWEAPSNRSSGRFKDTHHKRRDWWRHKALEVGIVPGSDQWISRTAKSVHPTRLKPCKRCGRVMDIRYVYPQKRLLDRFRRLPYIGIGTELDPLVDLSALIEQLIEEVGPQVMDDLPQVLATGSISPPQLGRDQEAWLQWIEREYVPLEPSILSPGAMSNAPDRFDGFHSFNLCCRAKADTGRSQENLRGYATDRRVFEYWTEGDWIAANELMGHIRSKLRHVPCANGHPGPCTADHIGPLSLGFTHCPEFQLLCQSCNSAKNNRLTYENVQHLRARSQAGAAVASWHSLPLWELCSPLVADDETALRLSKLLRDNHHTLMSTLQQLMNHGQYSFLASLLDLSYADYAVSFVGLGTDGRGITSYERVVRTGHDNRYASEQKARRLRVAFESLRSYAVKENRNAYIVGGGSKEERMERVLDALSRCPESVHQLDEDLGRLLGSQPGKVSDEDYRRLVDRVEALSDVQCFIEARQELQQIMVVVAQELRQHWNDERYVRGPYQPDM